MLYHYQSSGFSPWTVSVIILWFIVMKMSVCHTGKSSRTVENLPYFLCSAKTASLLKIWQTLLNSKGAGWNLVTQPALYVLCASLAWRRSASQSWPKDRTAEDWTTPSTDPPDHLWIKKQMKSITFSTTRMAEEWFTGCTHCKMLRKYCSFRVPYAI